jgi:hypothetical protein
LEEKGATNDIIGLDTFINMPVTPASVAGTTRPRKLSNKYATVDEFGEKPRITTDGTATSADGTNGSGNSEENKTDIAANSGPSSLSTVVTAAKNDTISTITTMTQRMIANTIFDPTILDDSTVNMIQPTGLCLNSFALRNVLNIICYCIIK